MEETKLTKKELLSLEKYVERLHKEFNLRTETYEDIKYKVALLFKDAPDD